MARFLLLFRPQLPLPATELIARLDPLILRFHADVEHRSPAHLSAMVRGEYEMLRLQLIADVQAKADGPVLELVLMSREAMGAGAPHTKQLFENLVAIAAQVMPDLDLVFRSDRDGALPDRN
ncbi:hypothetical protein [Synechococcus sp. CS-1332]|uniref:hypothetical protein n=1 Tax=Synechococcus sp. CS-1332 TaxID=2847972 RepID=UPI00223AD047|nr:hypothetical protein [Synechococcus sp. CS-1332]MCT0206632.1 hypothetical protein [Synechococcus sp. CS-1332]